MPSGERHLDNDKLKIKKVWFMNDTKPLNGEKFN